MTKNVLISIVCLVSVSIGSACSQVESQTQRTETSTVKTEPVISNTTSSIDSVSYLCHNLHEIKYAPYNPEERASDRIYDGLRHKGMEAVPCLIGEITDSTPMRDPRSALSLAGFCVGDMAVFMLLYITEESWHPATMFSPEYAERWKEDGIYAYKAYVEKPANRAHIQDWWKNGLKILNA